MTHEGSSRALRPDDVLRRRTTVWVRGPTAAAVVERASALLAAGHARVATPVPGTSHDHA